MRKPVLQAASGRGEVRARASVLRRHLPWAGAALVGALLAADQTALGVLLGALIAVMLPAVYARDASKDC